ncbi:hypothetical protein IMSAG049_01324 [Clostridiales bacterium]|nr:hypothetical protein IMSAG049_01324 [Clostridiales bacterium]
MDISKTDWTILKQQSIENYYNDAFIYLEYEI